MILDGLSITVIGMAIVFGFLVILVFSMLFLNFLLRKFFPKSLETKTGEQKNGASGSSPAKTDGKDNLAIVAAAVAAIKTHIAVSRG